MTNQSAQDLLQKAIEQMKAINKKDLAKLLAVCIEGMRQWVGDDIKKDFYLFVSDITRDLLFMEGTDEELLTSIFIFDSDPREIVGQMLTYVAEETCLEADDMERLSRVCADLLRVSDTLNQYDIAFKKNLEAA